MLTGTKSSCITGGNHRRFHVIIGTRQLPGFPLTKMRMADQVSEFGLADLRFDFDEAAMLFSGELSEAEVQSCLNRSEGWVAALHLLRQSGRQGNGVTPDFEHLSELANYLNEQYFEQLDETQQSLLLHTAHVSRLDGDLADQLTGRTDGWACLSDLATTHALIFVDHSEPSPSYRYHQLLRDFLVSRQCLLGQEALQKLHQTTAEWFARQGQLRLAMRHACRGDQPGRAAEFLLEAGGVQFGIFQGAASLAPCLEQLPMDLIYRSPRLLTAQAYLFLKAGRLADSRDILDGVRETCSPVDRVLERELMLVEAHMRVYADSPVSRRQVEALEHAIAATPATDPLMRGLLNNFLCIFLMEQGELTRARAIGESAMAFYTDIGARHLQLFMYLHLSAIELEQGALLPAAELRDQAQAICQSHFSFDPSLRAIVDIYQCEQAFESCMTEGLLDRLSGTLDRIDRYEGWNMLYVIGFETCLSLLIDQGEFDRAIELLEGAAAMIARRGIQMFAHHLQAMELDLAVQAGATREAQRLAGEVRGLPADTGSSGQLRWRGRVSAQLALARYEADAGDMETARERLILLEKDCRKWGYLRLQLRVLVRLFLVQVQLSDVVAAEATLKAYLAGSAAHGGFGAVMGERHEFTDAARWVVTQNGLGRFTTDEIRHLAECLWRTSGRSPMEANILADLLTAKEFEVLSELAKGDANKVIARSLKITEPTVKFHLQNIYRKIGVNSRKLAMEIARKYGTDVGANA